MESVMPWCVFCAHDEFREPEGALGDFNWIDRGRPRFRVDQLRLLPYDGPRWYSRQAAQWLLHWSVCTWDDIKLTYSATAHLPPDFFVAPIATIEATTGELGKHAINGLLGLWGIDQHYS